MMTVRALAMMTKDYQVVTITMTTITTAGDPLTNPPIVYDTMYNASYIVSGLSYTSILDTTLKWQCK
jgi:hypothetical protein